MTLASILKGEKEAAKQPQFEYSSGASSIQIYEATLSIILVTLACLWRENARLVFPEILYLLVLFLGLNLGAAKVLSRWPSEDRLFAAIIAANLGTITAILGYSGGIESNLWVLYLLPIYTSCILLGWPGATLTTLGSTGFILLYHALKVPTWGPDMYFSLAVKCSTLVFAGISTKTLAASGKGSYLRIKDQKEIIERRFEHLMHKQGALGQTENDMTLYQRLIHQSNDSVCIVDPETGRFLDVNEAACKNLGYHRSELLRMTILDVSVNFSDMAAWKEHVQEVRQEGQLSLDSRARHSNGKSFWVDVNVKIVSHQGREYMITIVRDITTRKTSERRLMAQYEIASILAESASIEEAAPEIMLAICESLEWEVGVLWEVDDRRQVLRCRNFWRSPKAAVHEFEVATRNSTFALGIDLPGRVWLKGHPNWIPDVTKDANSPRSNAAALSELHGAFAFPIQVDGKVVGIMEFFSPEIREPDVTLLNFVNATARQIGQFMERRKVEEKLRASEERLFQSQKMEAIGRLAGGIAHDFNNILTSIIGLSQLQLASLQENDPVREDFEEILKSGQRGAALTAQLLALSRRQMVKPKVLDLNAALQNMGKLLGSLIGEHIKISTVLQPELGAVRGDPGQLEQLILNLVVNARDAMPEGGDISIKTTNVAIAETLVQQHDTIPTGLYVALEVADTGSGMSGETLSHLFEPFFTTKPRGKGTGLGLSTVYGIIKQSSGFVSVRSAPGKGTAFTLYFPKSDRDASPAEAPSLKRIVSGNAETILLVEDEESVRKLARRILVNAGYTVLEAANGQEAVEISRKNIDSISLVITDIVMPEMNGTQLALWLKKERPDLKVLFLSGYTDDSIALPNVTEPGTRFMNKPFSATEFTGAIRDILASRPAIKLKGENLNA